MMFSRACVSALLAPAAVTARLMVANNLEVHSEPNRISNMDGGFEDSNSKDEGGMASHPTADIADSGSSNKEECSPPVTVSKSNKIDAGNLPLSSCSSLKKQICIIKNVMKSSSSIEKKTGFCTNINDVPIAYWDTSDPSASSEIPASYWEDNVPGSIPTGHTTTKPVHGEVPSKISIYDNNSKSQLSDVEEQLDFDRQQQYQQHQLQQLDERHLAALDCSSTCSDDRPVINLSGEDFKELINNCIDGNTCPYDLPINCWDTSRVTDMSKAFKKQTDFNDPLECWNTSSATTMENMFYSAYNFNQPIGEWDTSSVTSMLSMFTFYDGHDFNQPIGEWNTSSVTSLAFMFLGNDSFNQPIGGWDISSVTFIDAMFKNAVAFNQPIGEWDTSQVKLFYNLFASDYNIGTFNQPIGEWNTSSVYTMFNTFRGAINFNQPIREWNTSSVTTMQYMFDQAFAFNQPIDEWDVSEVADMSYMFKNATSFSQCLSTWAGKTGDVNTNLMLVSSACPDYSDPDQNVGPWCQNFGQGCFRPGLEPSFAPSSSSVPSAAPSDGSGAPSFSSAPSSECDNSASFRFDGDSSKTCESFVAEKPRKRCRKKQPGTGKRLRFFCPSTCKKNCNNRSINK
jgi:surface protein